MVYTCLNIYILWCGSLECKANNYVTIRGKGTVGSAYLLVFIHYTKHAKEHVFSLVILMSCYLVKQTPLNIFRQSNNAPNNLN